MIKRVYQIADVHVHNYQRMDEYKEQLNKVSKLIEEDASKFKKEECRIVICGDIVHSKTTISNELIVFVSTWIRELEKICKVIFFSGNHDQIVGNTSRMDTLTAIFQAANFQNSIHLDSYLGYDSGVIVEDNITWVLYSVFSDFRIPTNIDEFKANHPNNVTIGLFHGALIGSALQNGQKMENGVDCNIFKDCDFVMAGDIHKRQVLTQGDCEIVYAGSVIQQTFGESVTQHGIVIWDIENRKHEFVDIPSEYGLYDFTIHSPEDLDKDKERLNNL